jgi:type I restriction enzyme S subunit
LDSGKRRTIDPGQHPGESFEYYSIPAYQEKHAPLTTKGAEIASTKLLLEPRSVLFGKLNPRVEKVWRVRARTGLRQIGSTEWLPIVPHGSIDSEFLYFLCWSNQVMHAAKGQVSGSTPSRQRVDPAAFYRIRVPLPPIDEQQQIAAVLSAVQRAIERQERLIALTAELKKALMHKLFTEGTRGELLKQSEIGPIPKSWELTPVSSLVKGTPQNGAFIKKPTKGSGFLFANVVNMYGDVHVDAASLERLDVPAETVKQYLLGDGDILVVRSSLKREGIGQSSVVHAPSEPMLFDCHLIRVRLDRLRMVPEFLSFFWRSDVGKADLIRRSKTTTMTTLNQKSASTALVPVPSMEEQASIVSILLKAEGKIRIHRRQFFILQTVFRTLLDQLITAKIRVHDLNLSALEEVEKEPEGAA